VYIDNIANTTHTMLWTQSGQKGQQWLQGQMPIPPQSVGYTVSFAPPSTITIMVPELKPDT
jgi:hypothetical protein